jgi:hypothetical protein
MKRKRWEESLTDDGSEDSDWERERQERQARLQMQLLMNEKESFWSLMVSTEERIRAKQRTASTTIAATVRRRLARYACVYIPSPFALAPPPVVSPRSVLPRKQYCFKVEPRNDLRHLQMP